MGSIKPIRWGVLGSGWVAQHFLADLKSVDGCEAIALASRSDSRAHSVATEFGVRRSYGSYEALAADPEVDVIYIASEHHEHARHCLLALSSGKHVLCEKPFATSLAEASEVAVAAQSAGLFCMEAMWSRFLPAMQEAKRLIDAGTIGASTMLTADFSVPAFDDGNSRFFDPARGGGALLDRGVYAVSLATWLFGKPVEVVARAERHALGADKTVAAIMRFADERLAIVTASLGGYSSNQAVVAGTKGRIVLHEPFYRPERISVRRVTVGPAQSGTDLNLHSVRERVRRLVAVAKPYLPVDFLRADVRRYPILGYGYRYEAAEVARCLREGLRESPVMPLRDTLLTMATIDQIRVGFSL